MLPLAVLAASMLISYERAKAESLGFDARGGLMERAERIIVLGLGLLFDSLLIPVLWVMLALTLFTAVQRFVKVWRQASTVRPRPDPAPWRTRRTGRSTAERTRVRRERWAQARRPLGADRRRAGVERQPTVTTPTSSPQRWRAPCPSPRPMALRASRGSVGPGSVVNDGRRSSATCERVHGPGFGGLAMRRAVAATYESYARYWAESFRLPGTSPEELDAGFSYTGWEHVERGLAAGNGVIIALPHLGGWEWAGFWTAVVQRRPISVVVEALEPPSSSSGSSSCASRSA